MGYWGHEAWENDAAADWFDDLFDQFAIEQKVQQALEGDPEVDEAEIRAAAFLLIQLGIGYVWPGERLDDQISLAIQQLHKVKACWPDDPNYVPFRESVDRDIATLRSRLSNK